MLFIFWVCCQCQNLHCDFCKTWEIARKSEKYRILAKEGIRGRKRERAKALKTEIRKLEQVWEKV